MSNAPKTADEKQFVADLRAGLDAMKESAATATTCVLPAAQVRAVLTVLEAATGALSAQPAERPRKRR
jgi:nucleoid-associated protein YgaU